jgi:adenylate cyclase
VTALRTDGCGVSGTDTPARFIPSRPSRPARYTKAMSIEDWIVQQGLSGRSVTELVAGLAERLLASGVPLARIYVALPTVNATVRVMNHVWTPSGAVLERISHTAMTGQFEKGPFGAMTAAGERRRHWRFAECGTRDYAIFADTAAAGGGDYLAHLVPFENENAPDLRGVAAAFSSARPEGFMPDETARIDALVPLLALAAYRITLFDVTVGMLDTYVGRRAGRQVLAGEMRRGGGRTLRAALMIADLQGFTSLSETAGPDLIGRLDDHLDAMASAVAEESGEVLKFMGDGVLAVFPVASLGSDKAACAAALRAAKTAIARNDALDAGRVGEPPLPLDVALHLGDVFYGNIGAANRMDFTVIGPAVNEVARIESLCGPLACPILMSSDVAQGCGAPVRSLGRHRLRGVANSRELFAPVE